MKDFDGKTALVTGAGSGFGWEIATRLAERGAHVLCVDLNAETAEATANDIIAAGGRADAIQADVASEASARAMAEQAEDIAPVDVVFANAGIAGSGSATDTELDEWNRTLSVNTTGVWLTSRFLLPAMIERRAGSIVNTGSVVALRGIDRTFSYTASKGAVVAMTRQMAADFGPKGIRVNAICPGTIPTPFIKAAFERKAAQDGSDPQALMEATYHRYALGHLGEPDDVAEAAIFLASDRAKWVTGTVLSVDGGYAGVSHPGSA